MTLPVLSVTKGGQTRMMAKARRDGCYGKELKLLTMEVLGMKTVEMSSSILHQRKTPKTHNYMRNRPLLQLLRLPLLSKFPPIKFPLPLLSIQVLPSSVGLVLSPHQFYLSPFVWTRTAWSTPKLSCQRWWPSW